MEIITTRLLKRKNPLFRVGWLITICFRVQANTTLPTGAKAPKTVAKPVGVSAEHRRKLYRRMRTAARLIFAGFSGRILALESAQLVAHISSRSTLDSQLSTVDW